MKLSTLLSLVTAPLLSAAQFAGPYTDPKSQITTETFIDATTGYFFGIALPSKTASNTDFIGYLGGKGTGWSGVSLGGGMLNKLLIVAWPNGQNIVSSFRKTAQYGSPAVTTGTFTQTPIPNGTYTNATHWAYTFLCSRCIQSDNTTFKSTDTSPTLGWATNSAAPAAKSNSAASVSKHTSQGNYIIDLTKAHSQNFEVWKEWAAEHKEDVLVERELRA